MKTLIFITIFTCTCFLAFSQSTWKLHKFDKVLSFRMPESSIRADTLGQQIFQGTAAFGIIVVSKMSAPENLHGRISNREELNEFYRDVQRGIMSNGNGTLLRPTYKEIGGLAALEIEYETKPALTYSYTTLLFVKNNLYSFTYAHNQESSHEAAEEQARLIKNISIDRSIKPSDQLTYDIHTPGGSAANYKAGQRLGTISLFVVAGMIALLIFLWTVKQFYWFRIVRTILAALLIAIGGFELFAFFGNLFLKQQWTDLFHLLIIGVVLFLFGFALLQIKTRSKH